MIPLHLRLSGFLSYRDATELDFSRFDLACISGANGAGKSTLLDAITWALFGQARRRDDALINLQCDATEVVFTFRYEQTDYRILRSLRRGKGGSLEFQASHPVAAASALDPQRTWKPLTERTQRETQARIEQIFHLDYETFVNASFFLQGKADLFAQQTPARRKEVLSNILGMEAWESFRSRASERRKALEAELASVRGRLEEIRAELGEEAQRTQRLGDLETNLQRLIAARTSQAATLDSARRAHVLLEGQRMMLTEQSAALGSLRSHVAGLKSRIEDRQEAVSKTAELTRHATDIESAYRAWRETLAELEGWETVARRFQDRERQRTPLLQQVSAEQARLSQQRQQLETRQHQVAASSSAVRDLELELQHAAGSLRQAEADLQQRSATQTRLATERQALGEKASENKHLKDQMEEIKLRIDTLEASSGAACPLCGQSLTKSHRRSTLANLKSQGKQLGNQYRTNTNRMQEIHSTVADLETHLATLGALDTVLVSRSRVMAQLTERLQASRIDLDDWEQSGKIELAEISRILDAGDFAAAARSQLAALDAELAGLGYDAAAHDRARLQEAQRRSAEDARARLQSARAALEPLENELRNLESQLAERQVSLAQQETQVQEAQRQLSSLAAEAPDLGLIERQLFELQEQENALNQEVGAARQRVAVLADLRLRGAELEASGQALALKVGQHKMLESAFGKDGVPALLVEQALPEVEMRANEILDRLSDGRMSVHFETQAAYRDRKRDDLRETLEIKISDGVGQRAYEMFSGGEAFRANFAIRLALSQVLAGRKGARLQTLVIDEGFGSQDNQGVQRLIETINLIRPDFALILVISHLDELKDAFPTRIQVEKTERGSILTVN